MNRNIAKPFAATLSLLDVASDKTNKYKCFHGEDIQLTVNVVGENNRPLDLSNTSVKIFFTLDKNVNEPVYRQDTGIVVNNLGIITVMLEKSYIRIGNNTLKIVLYDEDQTVFLQPLIISCIDPLIGETPDLETPDDINVRDEIYDIRRIIVDLQDFDDLARNEHETVGERLDNFDSQLEQNITDINKKINNISTSLTIRSVGIQLQNDSEMDYFINNFNDKLIKMKILGITDVMLCPVIYNRNTRVDLAFTFDKLINCCNLVKNNGLKLTVKVHCWGDTFGETFDKILWFESYKNVLIRILNIGDIVRIGLMNETPFLTDNDNYKTDWLNLCKYIKTTYPNVELISSPTTSSEYNVLNHFCDYICFNCYPSNTVNNPVCNLGDTLLEVYKHTDYDIEGKYKNPNYNKKKIFITECGIQPYEYSHLHPWEWETNPLQKYNEDVQAIFYEDMIGYVESTDWITGISWWISGSDDTTWTFLDRKAESIIKERWGNNE